MTVDRFKSRRTVVAFTVLALLATACGSSASTTAPSGTAAPTTAAASGAASNPTGASSAPTAGPSATPGTPVAVCELAYVTGEFAPYGPALSADVVFPVKEVINPDPPLGRPWVNYKEDLGTVGEAQAAKTCLEKDGA